MFAFLLVLNVVANLFGGTAALADTPHPYYGERFYESVLGKQQDQALVASLREILTNKHLRKQGALDTIVENCDSAMRGCYGQSPVGYKTARKLVLGQLYMGGTADKPTIEEVYCQKDYTRDDFPSGPAPGPGVTPDNRAINVEHTWPQSKFNTKMNKDMQKSDLHHLFPTNSEMNRIRGHLKFGEVVKPAYALPCTESKMGSIEGGNGLYFEPPSPHKGNVARALFYFSVRYQLPISSEEEAFLKKWNEADPVDPSEAERNNQIQNIQGNRNPFVDYPELANAISDF